MESSNKSHIVSLRKTPPPGRQSNVGEWTRASEREKLWVSTSQTQRNCARHNAALKLLGFKSPMRDIQFRLSRETGREETNWRR